LKGEGSGVNVMSSDGGGGESSSGDSGGGVEGGVEEEEVVKETTSNCFGRDFDRDGYYDICTCNDLQKINSDLSASYELIDDIDCSEISFNPIGYSNGNYWEDNHGTGFRGSFNGNGRKITNLKINPDSSGVGLFAYTDRATIEKVGLENININGYSGVGALIGYAFNTYIEEVYSTGSVSAQGDYAGGLVSMLSNSEIYNSYSKAYVSGNHEVGGAVGYMVEDSNLVNTYTTGSVISSCKGGGLVGETYSTGRIENSFATGSVSGMSCSEGGLIGVYSEDTAISNSYWYSGSHSSCTGENYASDCYSVSDITEFYNADNEPMVNWDFGNIWQEVEGDYPALLIFKEKPPSLNPAIFLHTTKRSYEVGEGVTLTGSDLPSSGGGGGGGSKGGSGGGGGSITGQAIKETKEIETGIGASLLDKEPKIKGYIIEFKEEPLIAKELKLKNEAESAKDKANDYAEKSKTGFFLLNYYEEYRANNLKDKYEKIQKETPEKIQKHSEKLKKEHENALHKLTPFGRSYN